ncbi:MAG: hypothetical protein J6C57_06960 [Paludibacteraceae bacterium]|nr:hypothetical protein [Paludibacteraceae bacterium]
MKRCIYLLVAILLVSGASAQTRSFDEFKKQQQSRFSKFKADKQAELEAFRKQQNERYAQFMEESWQRFRAHPAILPKQEKRVKPVIYQEPTPEPVPVVEPVDTTPAPAPVVEPEPVVEPVDTTPAPAPVVEPEPVVEPVDTTPAPAPVVEPEPVVEPVDTTPAPAPVVEPTPIVEPEPVVEPVDTTPAPAPIVEPEPVVEPAPVPQPKEEPKVEPKPVVEPKPAPAPVPSPAPEPKVEEKPILVKKEVIKVPQPTPEPEPLAPVEPKEEIPHEKYHVTFYGTKVSVGFPTNETLKLPGLSEKQLAKAWKQLSSEAYDVTLNNVLAVRKKLALCDWGYVEMLQAISEKKYGKTNEAVFMQAYLLSQSGYKIRLATDDEKLYMLIATQQNMFSLPFFIIDNTKFYALNCKSQELSICKAKFDKEKVVSLQLRQEQKLAAQYTDPRKLTSKYGVVAQVSVNKNTIDFFNDYPSAYIGNDATTRWAVYANTPLEKVIRETLYPTLKKAVAGLSERDAVNKILNFVQTAFVYEYDDKIWGGDRAFFAAETLHYPYADCEDRSILFSRLVRDILGLDVILIYYPGHLATAVAFTQDVHGDYLTHNNRKYIVCDPTYINAPLGRTMPGMNNQEARIIEL